MNASRAIIIIIKSDDSNKAQWVRLLITVREPMPEVRGRASNTVAAAAADCPICFDRMEEGEMCETSCGHRFHMVCLEQWKEMGKNTCPCCRQRMKRGRE